MDEFLINILNCSKDISSEQASMKTESLLYAYRTLGEYSDNLYVKEISQKRLNSIEAHYMHRDYQPFFNSSRASDNGLGEHYNNAINMLNRGLNEFNCGNALRELLQAIKDEPQNILFQTLIQLISEAERSAG